MSASRPTHFFGNQQTKEHVEPQDFQGKENKGTKHKPS